MKQATSTNPDSKPQTNTATTSRRPNRPSRHPESRTHKPEHRTPPERLAPSPKAKTGFDSLAVGGGKHKSSVRKEVSAQPKSCGNFESEVKKAARPVAEADKAVDAAEAHVETVEAAAGTARAKRSKANGERIGKLWWLGHSRSLAHPSRHCRSPTYGPRITNSVRNRPEFLQPHGKNLFGFRKCLSLNPLVYKLQKLTGCGRVARVSL